MLSLLIIDDDKKFTDCVKMYFSSKDISVETAETGAAGVAAFRQRPSDVVILDLGLPDKEGKEICIELHTIKPDIMIAVLTGYHGIDLAKNYDLLKDKVKKFFCKPCDLQELEFWINHL